jgi:hypothetical protein
LDYDGVFEISGGLLVAAGSSGMAEAPSDSSKQYSVAINFSSTQQAGKLVSLKDSKGNTIAIFKPNKSYQTVVISSPELKKGTAYTVYSGGSSAGNVSDGLYTGGVYQDGTKIVDFTISKITTWMSETGETTGGGFKGPGGGGRPGGPGAGGNQGGPGRK